MRYPEKLNKGDYIGVTAISCGIDNDQDLLRFENAIRNLENLGYKVKTTENCKTFSNGRSSSAEERVRQFMELYKDESVKAIIFLEGGDFACEMLDYLDFEELSKLSPKWIMGYSDCTNLTLTFNILCDTVSIYGPNFKSFGMGNLHESLTNSLRLMEKEEFVQNSYEKCEKFGFASDDEDPYYGFNLVDDVKYVNLKGGEEVSFKGRCIGGCIDLLREVIIGSKFDKLKEYCEKYKEDGIVWFLEEFEGTSPENYRTLWRMRNMGLFDNCKGIIFGRPLMVRADYDISYEQSILDALEGLDFPIVSGVDIGHLAPQIPIISGSILEVHSQNGKGNLKSLFN